MSCPWAWKFAAAFAAAFFAVILLVSISRAQTFAGFPQNRSSLEGPVDHGRARNSAGQNSQRASNRVTLNKVAAQAVSSSSFLNLVSDSQGNLFSIDLTSGNTSFVGTMSQVMFDIAFDLSGQLYGVDGTSDLYRIDASTGATTLIGELGVFANSLEFRRDGVLFAAGDNVIYTVETNTGTATPVFTLPSQYQAAGDIAFDSIDDLYLTTADGTLIKLSPDLASWTAVGSTGFSDFFGLIYGPDGVMYGFREANQMYRINLDDASGSFVANITDVRVNGVYGAATNFKLSNSASVLTFFPLLGLDAYTAPVISVFDHSMKQGSGKTAQYKIYGCDRSVEDYFGEVGNRKPDVSGCSKHPGYENATGRPFEVNGHYVGVAGDTLHLNYDGHPGFDYQADFGTDVYAASAGVVHYPSSLPGLGKTGDPTHADLFNVLELDPGNGYKIYYLHLSTHPRTISLNLTANAAGQDFLAQKTSAVIGSNSVETDIISAPVFTPTERAKPQVPKFSIAGRITFEGNPLSSVQVQLDGWAGGRCVTKAARTNAQGVYKFTQLIGGWYHVRPVGGQFAFSPSFQNAIVQEGDSVQAGQLIGRSGNAGCVAPHLHFEVRQQASQSQKALTGLDFIPVDPYGWLGGGPDPYTALTGVMSNVLWPSP